MREISQYETRSGRSPFSEWVARLDESAQGRIYAYVVRVAAGASRKNVKPVGQGVFEIKIDEGPGYRVYFGLAGQARMILLCGGDKKSQGRDIAEAANYWRQWHAKNKDV